MVIVNDDDVDEFEPVMQRDILTGKRKISGIGMSINNIWNGGYNLDE